MLEPLASEAPPPPPPMMPAFFMGPDGRITPRAARLQPLRPAGPVPGAYAPMPPPIGPPPDTIFQGTVTNFGHFPRTAGPPGTATGSSRSTIGE